jgi:hypothetical protein
MADEYSTKRIINLPAESAPDEGDVFVVDNESSGTKKIQISNFVDKTLSVKNKAAEAEAVGIEIKKYTQKSAINLLDPWSGEPLPGVEYVPQTDGFRIANDGISGYAGVYFHLQLEVGETYILMARKKSLIGSTAGCMYYESTDGGNTYPSTATGTMMSYKTLDNNRLAVEYTPGHTHVRFRFYSSYSISEEGNVIFADVMICKKADYDSKFHPYTTAQDYISRQRADENSVKQNDYSERIRKNGCTEIIAEWKDGITPTSSTTTNTCMHTFIEVPKEGVIVTGEGNLFVTDEEENGDDLNVFNGYEYKEQIISSIQNNHRTLTGFNYFPYDPEKPYLFLTFGFQNTSGGIVGDTSTDKKIKDYFTPHIYTGNFINSDFELPLKAVTCSRTNANSAPNGIQYGQNGIYWNYRIMTLPLPLEYIDFICVDVKYLCWVFVYKYDPAKNRREYIGSIGGETKSRASEFYIAPAGRNFIDLSEYGQNYYGLICISPLLILGNNESDKGPAGREKIWPDTIGLLQTNQVLYIHWKKQVVQRLGAYGNIKVQKNLKFIESFSIRRPFISKEPNYSGDNIRQLVGSEHFAGVLYGGRCFSGLFWYHVSPRAYYTAAQNPNSMAYKLYDNTGCGYQTYGLVCSSFVDFLLGGKMPASTMDYRFNSQQFPEFTVSPFSLNDDLYDINRFDILINGVRHTGHCVLVNDIINVDNLPYIEVYESTHPCIQRNVFPISNGTPFPHGNNEYSYNAAYDYIARIEPDAVNLISEKSNWEIPYTDCTWKAANHRGYGAIYISGSTKCNVSCINDTDTIVLKKDGVQIASKAIIELDPVYANGYYVCDITNLIDGAGEYTIEIDGETEDLFYVIAPESKEFAVVVDEPNNVVRIHTDDPENIKYITAYYRLNSETTGANTLSFAWEPEAEDMTIPLSFDTGSDGYATCRAYGQENPGDYINIVIDSGIDDQTYYEDGLGVIGV